MSTSVVLATSILGAGPASAATGTTPQTIAWDVTPASSAPLAFNTTWTVVASSNSNLPVTLGTTTPNVCTIDGGTLSIISGTGTCEYYAEQLGDENYAEATRLTESVSVVKVSQSISFSSLNSVSDATSSVPLVFSVDSQLTPQVTTNTPGTCSISGSSAQIITPGTCSITVSQAGDANYEPATPVTQSFVITSSRPAMPTNVWVERGSHRVTVHWNEVTNVGDAPVDGYTVTAQPSGRTCATSSANETSCAITELNDGTEYSFSVVAFNVYGNSPSSVPMGKGLAADVPFWEAQYSCGIDGSKRVECWGNNDSGRATPPSDLENVKQIGVADYHSCALTETGLVTCWGYNGDGRSTVPNDLPVAEQLSVGDTQNCIIANNGTLRCFGVAAPEYNIPSDLGVVTSVSVGFQDICAIKVSGQLVCWGFDRGGIESQMPAGLDHVVKVSVTLSNACAVKNDHTYVCWGSELPSQATPEITGQIVKVSSSHYYSCALTSTGALSCWGEDWWGRISRKPSDLPPVSDFEMGRTHICVTLMNGLGVRCWGFDNSQAVQVAGSLVYGSKLLMASVPSAPRNVFARRGDQSATISLDAPLTNGGAPISSYSVVTVGFPTKQCTIAPTDPNLSCTVEGLTNGRSYSFVVKAVNVAGSSLPAVPLDAIYVSGSSGYTQCAVLTNHTVTCWGWNPDSYVIRTVPADLHNAVAVAIPATDEGACAVTTEGTIRCWGTGWGVNIFQGPGVPTDSGYVGITASVYNICAWKSNGAVVCWGWDGTGQVSGVPSGAVSKVTATHEHGDCAVMRDHTFTCWGISGGLDTSSAPSQVKDFVGSTNAWCAIDMADVLSCGGDGNIANNIPVDIGLVKSVAIEISNACAIKMDDTVVCWGGNGYGVTSVPADLGGVRSVFIGWVESACAIRLDGMPQCWGHIEAQGAVPTGVSVTPGRVPRAPNGVGARNTTVGVEVSWSAVVDNGGFPISGYRATATPGNASCTTTGTSCLIKGLNRGQRYSFQVTATNEEGTSQPSRISTPAVGVATEARDQPYGCVITGGVREIECWGNNQNGRATPPTNFDHVSQISLGSDHGCAINDSGELRCWGVNNSGNIPAGLDSVIKISAGRYKTCAINSLHDLRCWATDGQVSIPDTVGKVIDVSVGWEEICAIREDRSVTCWSVNWGSLTDPEVAITDAESIAVGQGTACAVSVGGTLRCWGNNANLWLPTDLGRVKKIDIVESRGFCAVTVTDQLRCWGEDWNGRFSRQPANLGSVSDVSVNDGMTCVVLLGGKGTRCWGVPDINWADGMAPGWRYGATLVASVQPSAPRNAVAIYGDSKATIQFDAPLSNGGLPITSYLVKARGTTKSCEVAGDATNLACDVTGLTNGVTYTFSVVARNEVGTSKSVATMKLLDISGRRGLAYCAVKVDHKVTCWGWVENFGVKDSLPADLPLAKKIAINWDLDAGCIITLQDTVRCWGGGWGVWNGALVSPLAHVTQLEMGQYHACALTESGAVTCWGYSEGNRTAVPTDLGPVSKIFMSMGSTCALQRDGQVICWGSVLPPSDVTSQFTDVIDLGIADEEWCVVHTDHSLDCYGYVGEVSAIPSDVGAVKSVTLGDRNACAIRMDDSAVCWGNNDWGKSEVPGSDIGVAKIVPGREASSCLLDFNADVVCWGYTGDTRNESITTLSAKPGGPPSSPLNVRATNAPRGVRVTWDVPAENGGYPITGYTARAQPGNKSCSTTVGVSVNPLTCVIVGIESGVQVNVGVTATSVAGTSEMFTSTLETAQVSVEYEHVCAVTSSGTVKCWGNNDNGQTVVPSNLGTVTQVATSIRASCALNTQGEVRCWGEANTGGLAPTDLGAATKITMGISNACALLVDTTVRCWGENGNGQNNIPAGTTNVTSINAQSRSTCLVFADKTSSCYGQVWPAPNDLGEVLDIIADEWHTCAMLVDHSLRCWGDGNWSYVPSEFAAPNSIKAIQVDWATTCVIKADDMVTCWGYRGSLGSENFGAVKSISQGWQALCAVKMNDHVVCGGEIPRVNAVPSILLTNVTLDVLYAPTSPRAITKNIVDQSVVVSWNTPLSDGGSPITGYTAYIPQTNSTCTTSVQDENPLSCALSLPSEANYDVIVYATNAIGDSIHFTFNAPRKQQMYFSPYSVNATASDGEVVDMVSNTPNVCSVVSSMASGAGPSTSRISLDHPGTCTLTASVPGGAPSITRSFIVKAAHRFSGLNYKIMYFDRNIRWSDDGRTVCREGTTPLIDSVTTWPNGRLFDTDCSVNNFMVHYSGSIKWPGVYDGTTTTDVTFHSVSDDGFHLEIDGATIIDDPNYHGDSGPTSAPITHLAGRSYQIDAWMFQGDGGWSSRLFWNLGDGNGEVVVPSTAFVPSIDLPKETQSLTWAPQTLALESGRVGQIFNLAASSDADSAVVSYGTTTGDTCEITGENMNQIKIIDDSGPCTFTASSDETSDIQAALPIQHTVTTLAGYGVTITQTDLSGTVPYFLDGFDINTGETVENTRTVTGVSNVLDPLSHTVDIVCVPQDRDLNAITLASDVELNGNGEFSTVIEIPRNIGAVTGCKLTGAVTGEAVIGTWDTLRSEPIRPIYFGASRSNGELTNVSIDVWGTDGFASYGLDWACPLCAMYAADGNGSFAVANQRDPMRIDTTHHSMWNYAGTHNPMAMNDNFKLVDPSDANSTVDYSDFTVDGEAVYTAKMALDLGVTFGEERPQVNVRYATDEHTGALVITEQSQLWRCTTDGKKLWSNECGDVIKAPVALNRITTIQPTGTEYFIEDTYVSTDGHAHTLVTASEMHTDNPENLQFKVISGVTQPMANYSPVTQSQNLRGTGTSMKILTKFDGLGDSQDNSIQGSASFYPSPTRLVTAKTGPTDTSSYGMSAVYENQILPANGNAVVLRQAYTVARDDATAEEGILSAAAFLTSGRSMLGQRIAIDGLENPSFTDGTTTIQADSSASLQVSFASTTPTVCTVGASAKDGRTSRATVAFVSAGTCHVNATQAGNDYYRAATSSVDFDIRLAAPSTPKNVTATVSGTKVTVKWAAPLASGGSPIARYDVIASGGLDVKSVSVNSVGHSVAPTSATFADLRQGITYNLTVKATNTNVGSQNALSSSATTAIAVKLPTVIYGSGMKWTVVGNKPAKVGNVLSATKGTWYGAGITYKYQWFRCAKVYNTPGSAGVADTYPKAGAGKCVAIAKATGATYKLVALDKGKFIVLSTKGVNAGLAAGVTVYTKSTAVVK